MLDILVIGAGLFAGYLTSLKIAPGIFAGILTASALAWIKYESARKFQDPLSLQLIIMPFIGVAFWGALTLWIRRRFQRRSGEA